MSRIDGSERSRSAGDGWEHESANGKRSDVAPRPRDREVDPNVDLQLAYKPPMPAHALRSSARTDGARGAKTDGAGAAKPTRASTGAPELASTSPRSRAADGVLYVGINPDSRAQEGAFFASTAQTSRVAFDPALTASLETSEGVEHAVSALHLPGAVSASVRDAILAAHPSERGELMQIARVWSSAYTGGEVPSRLVLSGHSVGDYVFGETGGFHALQFQSVHALAKAMPAAASKVEDVQLAACFTYRQISTDEKRASWLGAFPGLKTVWAYASKSPPAPLGHLAQWERGTRGAAEQVTSSPSALPFGVATWDVKNGYRGNIESKEQLVARQRSDAEKLPQLLDGRIAVTGHYDPTADGPYQTCRKIEGRPDFSPQERAAAHELAETYGRLRYYDQTREAFARAEARTLDAGYAELGGRPPDYAKLPRRQACIEAKAVLNHIGARLADTRQPPTAEGRAALERLRGSLEGLLRLDRNY